MISKEKIVNSIRAEYRRLDRITGVSTEGVQIKLSSRLTRKLGYFQVKKRNAFARPELAIVIAEGILQDKEIFLDVIRHEYAHALVYLRCPGEKHGHDKVWKAACREVGCVPKATRKMPEGFAAPAAAASRAGKSSASSGTGKTSAALCAGKSATALSGSGAAGVSSKARPYKYLIRCSSCGAESRYKTESKIVKIVEGKMAGGVVCRRCGGRKFTVLKIG